MFHRSRSLRTILGLSVRRYPARSSISSSEYCLDSVKKSDYENYLCCLLLPNDQRRASLALRAFNVELATIRDLVSKSEIGQGRIVFWREVVEKMYQGRVPQHPVAQELLWLTSTRSLTKHWFYRLIDSRELINKDRPHNSLTDAEEYSDKSVSPVYYLLLESCGIKRLDCDHTASHLGKAQGLTNLIRGVPFNASKGRVYLPLDLLAKHKISQEQVLRTGNGPGLTEVVFEIASTANSHLEKAAEELRKLPKEVQLLYLPMVALRSYLDRLQKADFNAFHPKVQARNNMLPWRLWKHRTKLRLGLG